MSENEKDRYLKNMYGPPQIVARDENTPEPPPGQGAVHLKVEFEEAREAEEWFGIEQDLKLVVAAATRAADLAQRRYAAQLGLISEPVSEDKVVEHSLWTTALITYVRCFTSGVRTRLDRSIFGDDEEMLRKHDYYKDIRDKHLAHSVNPFEVTATAIAVVDYDSEEPYVFDAFSAHFTRSTEDSPTMRYLAELAGWLQGHARQKRAEALKKVRRKSKELTREQIHQLAPMEVKPLQGYDAAKVSRPPRSRTEGDR